MSLCNPCPDCYLRGTAFPAFVSSPSWAPGCLSKAFPGPFQTRLCRGLMMQAGGGPSWAHLLFTRPPTRCLPHPHPRLASPGQHNGATSKFSFSAVSFQGPSPPPSYCPSTPRVGVGSGKTVFNSRPVSRQPCGYFFLINLTFPQSTSFPHLLPTRDIPEMAERKEWSQRDRQTHCSWDNRLDGSASVLGKSALNRAPWEPTGTSNSFVMGSVSGMGRQCESEILCGGGQS